MAGIAVFLLLLISALGETSSSVVAGAGVGDAPGRELADLPGGRYVPLFRLPEEPKEQPVAGFGLETAPVTNGEFLEFVRQNPRWRRSRVPRLFADEGYLRHWGGDLDLGPDPVRAAARPVVHVSWFAARAFAVWSGRRLPSTSEWEYAAGLGFTREDGALDPEFQSAIRRWYGTPTPSELPPVRAGRPNFFGVHDLHGLIWEWTSDFNSALVTGDARGDTGIERQLFCGAGSSGAADRSNFPAFLRTGFRSSLKAAYTLHNLGFRCALDVPNPAARKSEPKP
ncbi:MAG: formylglycine-generating enzyme family protein [Verrucomicrobiales bacterium]|nr:formylglycine-generating enzyme family protein [Verrucomicrobiales bacterium]